MVQILIVGAIAAIAILGWRGVRSRYDRAMSDLRKAQGALDKKAPMTLERDPITGVYRAPKRK